MSKRQVEKQNAAAEAVVGSFSQAIDASFQAEIAYIVAELQKNKSLTYTLSGLLKNDSLVALLDGRLQRTDFAASASKKKVERQLRSTARKFKNVLDSKGVVDIVLEKLLPEVFTKEAMFDMNDGEKLNYMCLLLAVNRETHLPHKYYPELVEVDKFVAACSQRFAACSQRLKDSKKTLEELKNGYYKVDQRKDDYDLVTCLLDTRVGDDKSVQKFPFRSDVQILHPFDMDTEIEMTGDLGKVTFKDLKASFANDEVEFPVAPKLIPGRATQPFCISV
jgi:hypothetical protein